MKSFLLFIAMGFTCAAGIAQNVAINNDGSSAHASAALDIKANNKGILIPRLTTAQRTAIVSPERGLLVFDADVNSFWFFNGAVWTNLAAGNGFAIPFSAAATSATDVFSITNNGKGAAVYGRNDGGKAAYFVNTNKLNIDSNVLEVVTKGDGNIPDNRYGNAASFVVNNANSVAAAVRAKINTVFGNFGAAAVFGESAGAGGRAGLFYASLPTGNGDALVAITEGNGNALNVSVPGTGKGRAGNFAILNAANANDVITVTTVGNGIAGNFKVNRITGTTAAVRGEVNSQFSNAGTAGIYGISSGTGGFGGMFRATNPNGNGPALDALSEGNGNAITAIARKGGDGVEAINEGTGYAIYGRVNSTGQGKAGLFLNLNTSNTNPVLTVETRSAGNIAVFRTNLANVARISAAGKGFFNGGTQNSGADLAEAFDVTGNINAYEPGDVLVIATGKDRAVEKSAAPYSTLVAGVYATKPGVLLTEENIDSDLHDKVPMGVVGVIPTRVCLEGGAIKRGDMLVTSSLPGVAMKADPDKIKPGQVIGKALQDYTADTVGKIKVLVNVK